MDTPQSCSFAKVKSTCCWSNPVSIIVGAPLVKSSKPLWDERASLLANIDQRNPLVEYWNVFYS